MSSTGTKTTLVDFSWPSGAKTVQITGDWNQWSTKEDLEIKQDGSFHKLVSILDKELVGHGWNGLESVLDPHSISNRQLESSWKEYEGLDTVDCGCVG